MSITFEAKPVGAARQWTLLRGFWRRLTEAPPVEAEGRKVAAAIRQLAGFSDRELGDIGLCRSDLTPDGLAVAGARRRLRQVAMDAEAPQRR